jgi:carboxypeptidase A1
MSLGRAGAFAALVATVEGSRLSRRDGYQMYEGKPLLQVSACKQSEVTQLEQALEVRECVLLADDFGVLKDGECVDVNAVCRTRNEAKDLIGRYPKSVSLQAEDTAQFFRKESGLAQNFDSRTSTAAAFYTQWRTLEARMNRVEELVNNAPSNVPVTYETAGQSHEGVDIKLVRFSGAGYTDGGPRAIFVYNLHAREWISGMAGIYSIEKLIERVAADPDFIKGAELIFIPMANPDGMKYTETQKRFQRKNTNGVENAGWFCTGGVDLNRNFDAAWGGSGSSSNRCSETYMGASAASEKETQVIQNLFKARSRNDVFIDVHSYTQVILSSWGYTRNNHPRKAEFDDLGNKMTNVIMARHGATYRYGATAQLLYAAAGVSNDYASMNGALGYCYELRPRTNQGLNGFAPPPSEILPTSEETWDGTVEAIKYTVAKR